MAVQSYSLRQIMDRERPPQVVGERCVVWGGAAKSGHGMFLWPRDEHRAAAWTKQVQRTRADFPRMAVPRIYPCLPESTSDRIDGPWIVTHIGQDGMVDDSWQSAPGKIAAPQL